MSFDSANSACRSQSERDKKIFIVFTIVTATLLLYFDNDIDMIITVQYSTSGPCRAEFSDTLLYRCGQDNG
jgi:hypothetical protein